MAWDRFHKSVDGDTGKITTKTGYSTEVFDWSNGATGDNTITTSPIDIPIKGDILVMLKFKSTPGAGTWVRIEHSNDNETWYNAAQSTTEAMSTSDVEPGYDPSRVVYIDHSTSGSKYFFLYDIDTHGMAKHTRFVLEDNGFDESSNVVTFTLMPHNL
tara:strand:+ start:5886 stop:6359 length:474 start_codon:yes stop_codon:yes gene_type:complete